MEINTNSSKNEFWSTWITVVLYAAFFYGVQYYFFQNAIVSFIPTEKSLFSWDVGYYKSIAESGYVKHPDGACNAGFFILFPLIWKISHLGTWGISMLNILFFATGFSILCNLFRVNMQHKILWLTIPAVYFAFIPYSEALFFLLSAIAIYGIKKNNIYIIWSSLILLSLTRAMCVFLGPALLAMTLMSAPRELWLRSLLTYFKYYFLPLFLGFILFVWYQYLCTGVWFAYFMVQEKFWGHKFRGIVFPFVAGAGKATEWIGALTMFVCVAASVWLIIRFFKWLFKNKAQDPLLLLSAGYLFLVLLEILFFNPSWAGNTMIISIFRYALMNPFFYIFLYYFTNVFKYTWKNYLAGFLLANIVWLAFGSYVHIQVFLYFMGHTLIALLFMLLSDKRISWPIVILIALNFYFQVHMFQMFIEFKLYPE